jgi:hypothetical protein
MKLRRFNENINQKEEIINLIKKRLKIFQREIFSNIKYNIIEEIESFIDNDQYTENEQRFESELVQELEYVKNGRISYNNLIDKIIECKDIDQILDFFDNNGLSESENEFIKNKVFKILNTW